MNPRVPRPASRLASADQEPATDEDDHVDVVIVGAGFTGLAAAYELALMGVRCRVFEREPDIGGLAGSFTANGTEVERFYHHWFSSDREIHRLCEHLGLTHLVEAHQIRTGVYYANSIYKLSNPLDLLRFAPLPFSQRVRLGLMALRARRVRHWSELDSRTAEDWLVELGGRQVYETVWRPLLEGKFGRYADSVAATWMWTKLHLRGGGSRSRSGREVLYYLRGGSSALLGALRTRLRELGVEVRTSTPVEAVLADEHGVHGVRAGGRVHRARCTLVTTAPGLLERMLAGPDTNHRAVPALRRKLGEVPYLANVCLVLESTRKLSDTYWLNVNDPSFPYVGVIEHTNLDDPARYGGRHLVYLSKYLPTDANLYRMSDEEIFNFTMPHLQRMFPRFEPGWIDAYHVWRAEFAQPVITPNYSRAVPPVQTAVPGLYLSSMAQVFPEDRGTNNAVRGGRDTARLIADWLATQRQAPLATSTGVASGSR